MIQIKVYLSGVLHLAELFGVVYGARLVFLEHGLTLVPQVQGGVHDDVNLDRLRLKQTRKYNKTSE